MGIMLPSDLMGKDYSMPQSSMDSMLEGLEARRKQENRRFWIPVIISIIALSFSMYAALKPSKELQPLILRDTVRIAVKEATPKIDTTKTYPKQKKSSLR